MGRAVEGKKKEVYRESYKKGAMTIFPHLLPERFPYMAKGFVVIGIEIRAAGCYDDGTEFQELIVITKESELEP